jgi:hypothetical protein
MRAATIAAGLVLALHASLALACGHCVEDKIAAVYDHALVMQALAQKHQVAFFAIDGNFPVAEATKKSIEAIAKSVEGIDKNSVKASVELSALSLAFDPERQSFAAIQKSLDKKLAEKKMTLSLIKIMAQPEKIKTASQ